METKYQTVANLYVGNTTKEQTNAPSLHDWRMSIEDVLKGACLINSDGGDSA